MNNGWQTFSKNIFIGCNKRTYIYKHFYPDSWYQLIKFVNTIGKSPIQTSKTAVRKVLNYRNNTAKDFWPVNYVKDSKEFKFCCYLKLAEMMGSN
jgi:hypothetical protein